MSQQLGQNSFTVSIPGISERPHGTTLHPWQYTRGHEPNMPASYLSTCDEWGITSAHEHQPQRSGHRPAHHRLQSRARDDEPLMHEPIEQLRRCLDDRHVRDLGGVLICPPSVSIACCAMSRRPGALTCLHVEHHLHRLLPERHHPVQPGQVEVVFDKVLRDLAEVLVAGQRAEPADPCERRRRRRRSCPTAKTSAYRPSFHKDDEREQGAQCAGSRAGGGEKNAL